MEAEILPPQASAFQRSTFKAWKVGTYGDSHPIELRDVETLAEAVEYGAPRCHHKEVFNVLETDEFTSKQILHVHVIKAGKPIHRYNHERGCPERIVPLKPVLIVSMSVDMFLPTEPFRWTPGCDVVGASRDVLEVRA